MSRRMWRRKYATAATSSDEMCRSACKHSPIDTEGAIATCSFRCRSAWAEAVAVQRRKPAAIGAKAPFPGFVAPALAT
jgi:hypothetical protein